jgi:hypothetical protein
MSSDSCVNESESFTHESETFTHESEITFSSNMLFYCCIFVSFFPYHVLVDLIECTTILPSITVQYCKNEEKKFKKTLILVNIEINVLKTNFSEKRQRSRWDFKTCDLWHLTKW